MILYPGTYLWRVKPGHQTQKVNMPQHALILHYISLKACFTHPVRLVAGQFIFYVLIVLSSSFLRLRSCCIILL